MGDDAQGQRRERPGNDLAGRWIGRQVWAAGGAPSHWPRFAGGIAGDRVPAGMRPSDANHRRTRYPRQAGGEEDIDDALDLVRYHCGRKEAVSIGLLGNAAEIVPELARRAKAGGLKPDLVTDQTSAHDLINGYLPEGWPVDRWKAAETDPAQHAELRDAAAKSCAVHVQAMLDFLRMTVLVVDYGNNIRQVALQQGVKNAFALPGVRDARRPLFAKVKAQLTGCAPVRRS